jgi:hypothetical protein
LTIRGRAVSTSTEPENTNVALGATLGEKVCGATAATEAAAGDAAGTEAMVECGEHGGD